MGGRRRPLVPPEAFTTPGYAKNLEPGNPFYVLDTYLNSKDRGERAEGEARKAKQEAFDKWFYAEQRKLSDE